MLAAPEHAHAGAHTPLARRVETALIGRQAVSRTEPRSEMPMQKKRETSLVVVASHGQAARCVSSPVFQNELPTDPVRHAQR